MASSRKAPGSHMAGIVERNIEALLERQRRQEKASSLQERIAAIVTRFTGSLTFVYLHVLLFGGWIVINLGWTPLQAFDPTFVVLAMFASVEAIFLSTFVLITQNRMQADADKRADLDLQISLLTEHEVTRLVELVSSIAERLNVEAASRGDLQELKRDVAPEQVLDKIEEKQRQFERGE